MQRLLRRFAEWATGFRADPFRTARWKLTGLYTLLLAFVVISLTLTLYAVHGSEIRELQKAMPTASTPSSAAPVIDAPESTVESYLERLARSIVFVDLFAILVSSVLSYFVAGRTLRPIRNSLQLQQRFFANAAHDLRTPLAVLRTQAEVSLADPKLSLTEARGVLKSSLEEVERMTRLASDLLALSGPDRASGREIRREWVDLSDLVQSAVSRLAAQAAEKGIGWKFSESRPYLVLADGHAVERALVNVLENALRYTPTGRVEVSLADKGAQVVVLVADTGIGIAPDDLVQVTQPFFRADTARQSTSEGAGLGLAIVNQIMTDHGGRLELSSQPGVGTVALLFFLKK